MNIIEILEEQARTRPDTPAIIDANSRTATFAELDRASRRLAALFRSSGLNADDAMLIFHPMSLDLYVTLLAAFRLGLIAMFLDPSAGRKHMERCCALGKPRALAAGPKAHLLRLLSPAIRAIELKFSIGGWMPGAVSCASAAKCEPLDEPSPASEPTPALLTFTSGSTGQPKAAMRTHGFLLAQHDVLSRTLNLEPESTDLATLPVFVLANLASGVTSLIPNANLRAPAQVDPWPILKQIDRHRPRSTAASPAFVQRLAEEALRQGRTLGSLDRIFCGGAPVFPRLLALLHKAAPEARVTAVYGSTEAEPIAEIEYGDISQEDLRAMMDGSGLLAGPPVSGINLRVIANQWGTPLGPYTRDEFGVQVLPANTPGEIVVNGPHVLPGYLHGHGDEETKFRVDGEIWHRSGDMGYLDAAGRVWLLGRASAVVEDEHGTLYPFAVECAAQQHPAILRAALVPGEGPRTLAVETGPAMSIDPDELAQSLEWARLDIIRVVERIPVDARHNAKVDYPALKKLLSDS